jgi:transposase
VDGLVDWLEDEELKLPARERVALAVLVNQLKELERQVEAIERELAQIQRVNPMAKLLSSIPGVGPIRRRLSPRPCRTRQCSAPGGSSAWPDV